MADKRISDAAAVTTETTVYVPGGAGGAPLKVATTAVGREVMGAASAAAARAALELDDRYARLGADNEYGGVQTVTDGVTGTVTVGPGQIVVESVGEEPSQTVITPSSVITGQYQGDGSLLTGLTAGQVVGLAAAAESAAAAAVTAHAAGAGVHPVAGVAGLQSALDAKQPLDADLTAIAALDPAGQDGKVLGVEAGEWAFVDGVAAAAAAADRQFATRGNTTALRLAGTSKSFDVCISTLQINDNGVLDDVVFVGLNYLGPTGRQDATQASIHDGWENCYKQYPAATYNQSERYVQYVLPDGTNGRTWMCEVRHTGPAYTRVNNSFWGNQVFRRVSDDRQNWYLTDSGVFSTEYGRIDFGANNAATVRQRRAAGGDDWVSLAYLDSSDVLQLAVPSGGSRPVVNTDGRVTVGRTLAVTHADHSAAVPTVRVQSAAGATALRVEDAGSQAVLLVSGDRTVTAAAGYLMRLEGTLTRANDSLFALQIAPAVSGNNGSSNHILFDVNPTVGAGTAPNSLALSRSYPVVSSGGTVGDVRCFDVQSAVVGSSTLTALYGYRFRDTYVDNGGGSALTTLYAFHVDDLGGGANAAAASYAWHSGKGRHRFGDNSADTRIGFFGATPATKPEVTGSRGGNTALASLITQLASLGLVTDSTTA